MHAAFCLWWQGTAFGGHTGAWNLRKGWTRGGGWRAAACWVQEWPHWVLGLLAKGESCAERSRGGGALCLWVLTLSTNLCGRAWFSLHLTEEEMRHREVR